MEASDPFDGDPYSLPSPVSDRVLRAIGLLVVEWGVFADRMELLIWWTLGLNEAEGRAVTTHLNDRARLDLIVTLALDRIDDPDSRDILAKKKRQAIASLVEDRNKVIHSTWMGSGGKYKGPTRWQRAQARSGVKVFSGVQGVSATVEHIQGIVTRSQALAEDLRDFLDDHGVLRR